MPGTPLRRPEEQQKPGLMRKAVPGHSGRDPGAQPPLSPVLFPLSVSAGGRQLLAASDRHLTSSLALQRKGTVPLGPAKSWS